MQASTGGTGCYSCGVEGTLAEQPPRERAHVEADWRVAHAFGSALAGWLVVLPRRHVLTLDELTGAEAEALGPLLADVTAALREVTGCAKTYVVLLAEKEGFEHVHFHVVPRPADLPHELRGPRVFELLRRPEAEWVADGDQDLLAAQVGSVIARRRA